VLITKIIHSKPSQAWSVRAVTPELCFVPDAKKLGIAQRIAKWKSGQFTSWSAKKPLRWRISFLNCGVPSWMDKQSSRWIVNIMVQKRLMERG